MRVLFVAKELIASCFILYCKWLEVASSIELAGSCVEILATSEGLADPRVLEGLVPK